MESDKKPEKTAIVLEGETSFLAGDGGQGLDHINAGEDDQADSGAQQTEVKTSSFVFSNNNKAISTKLVRSLRRSDRAVSSGRERFYQTTGFGRRLCKPNLLMCNLVLAGVLLGFFLWNFIVLTTQYVNEQLDTPVQLGVSVKNTGEPMFPAMVFCNSIPDVPLFVTQALFQETGRNLTLCYDETTDYSSGFQCTGEGFPNKDLIYYFSYFIETSDDYDEATPPTFSSEKIYCAGINSSTLKGYTISPNAKAGKQRKENTLFLMFDLNPQELPANSSSSLTVGLDGEFFSAQSQMPTQKMGDVLYGTDAFRNSTDSVIASSGLATVITLAYSEQIGVIGPGTISSFSPSAFISRINPEFLKAIPSAPSVERLSLVGLNYRHPRIETYQFSAVSFSTTFGSVSGWAGSLLGWDCLGLIFVIEKAVLLMMGRSDIVNWTDELL